MEIPKLPGLGGCTRTHGNHLNKKEGKKGSNKLPPPVLCRIRDRKKQGIHHNCKNNNRYC